MSRIRIGFIFLEVIILSPFSWAQEEQVRLGEELFKAIHFTYRDKVPDTIWLEVSVDLFEKDVKVKTQVWKEKIYKPGVRIVKKGSIGGDSIIYRNDSMHLYRFGDLIYDHHQIDLLTLMTLGIYWEEPGHFIKVMDGMKFDLETFHDGYRWGRKKWVIGALKPGEEGNEIWIDQDDLIVTRMFYYNYPQNARQQIEWDEFKSFGDFKIPTKVTISKGLDRLMIKRYRILKSSFP